MGLAGGVGVGVGVGVEVGVEVAAEVGSPGWPVGTGTRSPLVSVVGLGSVMCRGGRGIGPEGAPATTAGVGMGPDCPTGLRGETGIGTGTEPNVRLVLGVAGGRATMMPEDIRHWSRPTRFARLNTYRPRRQ